MRIHIEDAELRRRINANLQDIQSGGAARRRTEEREAKKKAEADRRARLRANKAEIKKLTKQLLAVSTERDGLQAYLDELLERTDPNPLGYAEGMDEAHYQGLLEECDAAVEGCTHQIIDIKDRLRDLDREVFCDSR